MHSAGMVQTVLGAVDPHSLGPTLTHEHLLVDVECYLVEPDEASERYYVNAPITMDNLGASVSRWFRIRDQLRLYDENEAIADAAAFRNCGGGTIVDVTSIGIGRDPLALARISRATGLHVVMGAGYYIPLSHPADLHLRTEDSLHEQMVREVTSGVGDSGIRAGILGELGCTYPLTETSRRVLSAAAAASRATGAPISIHPGPDTRSADEIIDALIAGGADPRRVAIGHLGFRHPEPSELLSIAEAGCYAQFDHFGSFEDTSLASTTSTDFVVNDTQRLEMAEALLSEGYGDRILFSHDVCWRTHRLARGGKGYSHVIETLRPRMRSRGWTDRQVDDVLVVNPARLLAFGATP